MAARDNPRPWPVGPIVRAGVAFMLLIVLVYRGRVMRGVPVGALVVLALALLLVLGDQIRRIVVSRRPPVEERVSKHPLGLDE